MQTLFVSPYLISVNLYPRPLTSEGALVVLLILPLLTTSEHPVRPHILDQGLDLFSQVSVSELVITGRPVGFIY